MKQYSNDTLYFTDIIMTLGSNQFNALQTSVGTELYHLIQQSGSNASTSVHSLHGHTTQKGPGKI